MTSSTRLINEGKMKVSPVFDWNYQSKARVKINQGGTSSGKTYALLQVIFLRLIEKQRIATVVGQDIPNLRKGAIRDFQERILSDNPWMTAYIRSYNNTTRTYKFKNGSILEFTSYKDEQDAKNGKRDILFVNEANGVPWPIYFQLSLRTTGEIFIDYNPSAPFWAHDKLMKRNDAITFYSNYTHNPFLSDIIIEDIVSLKEDDPNAWDVYGLGKTGSMTNLVFEKVTYVDKMPRYLKKRAYGLDFGYRASPTAFIECGLANEKDVYLNERFYLHRMKTSDIHLTFQAIGVSKRQKIYADPADPRAFDDLKDRGWKMKAADKAPNSVMYGIQLLNQYNLFITSTSSNLANEQMKYRYKTDKRTGEILNEPIKAFDHAWDAARYWGLMNLKPLRPISGFYRSEVV